MRSIRTKVSVKAGLAIILLLIALWLGSFAVQKFVTGSISIAYNASLRSELQTVEKALEHAFIEHDLQTVQQMVVNISYRGRLQVIRILNRDGTIRMSSIPAEIGIRPGLDNPQCNACHTDPAAATPAILQHPAMINGQEFMVTAKPLDNQIPCQSCHADAGPSLGVILAENDLAPLEVQLLDFTRGFYILTGLFTLVAVGVIWIGYHYLVNHPLRELLKNTGNSHHIKRQDEFGQLACQFRELNTSIAEQANQLSTQRRSFNALLILSESIDVSLTPEKVLQFAIGRVHEVTGFAAIAMRVFDDEQKSFRLVAHYNMTPSMVEALRNIPLDIGFTGDVYKTHRAAYTSDLSSDPRLESPTPVEAGYRGLISVPFLSGDRLMGSMELATKDVHHWEEDEIRWLELMGRYIGNVLHLIETSSQLQGMAIIQERSRIAQEIHDGLVQLIGTLRMWADQAQHALDNEQFKEVRDDLIKIEQAARDAYASLREEILGLRETVSPGQGIVPVIREFLSRYQRQWGIKTRLIVGPSGQGQTWISPAAEIQLLRIIQESLTNVRRHADASQVTVSIETAEDDLVIEIQDDGRGFDPHEVHSEKLGLRIMRERAASVRGRVLVESSQGAGTRLIVSLPRQTAPDLPKTHKMEDEL